MWLRPSKNSRRPCIHTTATHFPNERNRRKQHEKNSIGGRCTAPRRSLPAYRTGRTLPQRIADRTLVHRGRGSIPNRYSDRQQRDLGIHRSGGFAGMAFCNTTGHYAHRLRLGQPTGRRTDRPNPDRCDRQQQTSRPQRHGKAGGESRTAASLSFGRTCLADISGRRGRTSAGDRNRRTRIHGLESRIR